MNHRGSEGELANAGHSHLNYSAREKLLALSLASHLLIKQVGDRELNKIMIKLTKRQSEVVELMKKNWELGVYGGFSEFQMLQKGGLGRGGETKKINWKIIENLRKEGIIKVDETYREANSVRYVLNHPLHPSTN